ncbi:GntR family transcriptional regulator [Nocardia altamirensis]|uniref:GntR family transcriptional regulator n=1 Tax=Nocardia altamirensis TaxID=472158 RepID=UPI00084076DF|nr:GntR family transcriptional regulator [Nocardia altamirensis]
MAQPTVVDDITEQLAYRIAAGVYQPGDMLPSVRQVATEFNTSTPTANSALGRLAALGFVEARRGLGYLVRDLNLYGGIDTWRFMFRFAHRVPDRAVKLFTDLIDIEHQLITQAMRVFAADPRRYDFSRAFHAADRFELLATNEKADRTDLMAAELHVLRSIFAALGKPGFLSLFNTAGEIFIATPEASQAFYEPLPPEGHLVLYRKLQEMALSEGPLEILDLGLIELLIRDYHDQVVQTFTELIAAKATTAAATASDANAG